MADTVLRLTENALVSLLTPLVSGVTFYKSDYDPKTQLVRPAIIITALSAMELMGPFTGIYEVNCTITYQAKLDDTTAANLSTKWQLLWQSLYYDTSLASRLTGTGYTVHGVKHIDAKENTPDDHERLFIKQIDLVIVCMPS